MKFSVCNEVFAGWTWEKTCAFAKATGFEGIEIAPFTFAEMVTEVPAARRKEIRRIAADNGLQIAALHMLLYTPKGMHSNSPDPAVRRKTVDYLRAMFEFAGDLDCRTMIYGSPPTRSVHPSLTYRQARAYLKESLLACLDVAAARNVTLCMEPLPGDATELFNSVESVVAFAIEVNHPNLGVMADTKAMSTESRPVASTIRIHGPDLRHIHFNDSTGVAPGFGTLDFKPILQAIRDIRYTGWLSLEPFHYRPDAESNVPVSLRYLKSIVAELERGSAA